MKIYPQNKNQIFKGVWFCWWASTVWAQAHTGFRVKCLKFRLTAHILVLLGGWDALKWVVGGWMNEWMVLLFVFSLFAEGVNSTNLNYQLMVVCLMVCLSKTHLSIAHSMNNLSKRQLFALRASVQTHLAVHLTEF